MNAMLFTGTLADNVGATNERCNQRFRWRQAHIRPTALGRLVNRDVDVTGFDVSTGVGNGFTVQRVLNDHFGFRIGHD
jgi:hypothetical protein